MNQIPPKSPNLSLKVTEMGNIIETVYMTRRNNKQCIKMLPDGKYLVCSTGEVKDIEKKYKTRLDSYKSILRTFNRIRGLINTNITNSDFVRWCTLTYAENMTDTKRLMKDFEKFHKRFVYYCSKKGYSKPEYIVIMEPQGRGAWHAHLLYIWKDMKAPYIPNSDFADLWGHGFVKIKKLNNCDNIGAYLTAYLGDMEVSELNKLSAEDMLKIDGCSVVDKEFLDENGVKVKKAIVKGARLGFYPAKFNMFRHSKGILEPTIEYLPQFEAEKKVLGATKTFESAVKICDADNDFETIIIREQYNKARRKIQ